MSLATRLSAFAQAVGADIKDLRLKATYKGDWLASTTYKKGDLVWYSNDLWMALQTISGPAEFPDADYPTVWRLLTEGMPLGGNTGQILAKYGDASFQTEWIDAPSGGGGVGASFSVKTKPTADWTIPVGLTQVPGLATTITYQGKFLVMFSADLSIGPANGYVVAHLIVNGVTVSTDGAVKQTYSTDSNARFVFEKEWLVTANPGDVITVAMYNTGHASNNISATHSSLIVSLQTGIRGDKGETGAKGDPLLESTASAMYSPSIPVGAATWTPLPLPSSISITSSDGSPDFTRNSDGSLTVNKSGTYSLDCTVRVLNGSAVDNLNLNLHIASKQGATPGSADGLLAYGNATHGSSINNFPGITVSSTTQLTAGYRLMPYLWMTSAYTMQIFSFSITRVGAGPKGDKGDTGGNATVPIDPWHVVGTAGEPAATNGWATPANTPGLMFRKDPLGRVWIFGTAVAGTNGTSAFTLPVGYRPLVGSPDSVYDTLLTNGVGGGYVIVRKTTGEVILSSAGQTVYVDVSFDTGLVTAMPTGPQGPKGDKGDAGNTATVAVEDWKTLSTEFVPPFTSYGGNYPTQYRKRPDGTVELRGLVKITTGTTTTGNMLVLPAGYRPEGLSVNGALLIPATGHTGSAYVEVDVEVRPDGSIWLTRASSAITTSGWISLANVKFTTNQATVLTGPQGPKGDTGGNATVAMDGWHTVGTSGEPAFKNGWTSGGNTLRYRKDPLGKVQLAGSVGSGTQATVIFTLPVGFRPDKTGYYACLLGGGGAAYISIDASTGDVTASNFGAAGAWFDGVSWDTGTVTAMPTGPQGPKGEKGDAGNNSVIPLEGWTQVTSFLNGWSASDSNVYYRKDPMGRVWLRGSITGGANGTNAFQLPAGYRPNLAGLTRVRAIVIDNQTAVGRWEGQVNVGTDGMVVCYTTATPAVLSLDQVTFDSGTVVNMPSGPKGDKGDPGGVNVLTTTDWNTATTPGFYYSLSNMGQQAANSPGGDGVNLPATAGLVTLSEGGSVIVQRVYDMDYQAGYTRFKAGGTWTAWVKDITKPRLDTELMFGGSPPQDGDERYFQTPGMLTQGVMWKFRYHKVQNRWHFVGGADVQFSIGGMNPAAGGSATDAGLSFTFPLGGIFDVEWGARVYQNPGGASGNVQVFADQMRSGVAQYSPAFDVWIGKLADQGWATVGHPSKTWRFPNIVNGDIMRIRATSTLYNGAVESPYMRIRPVSVIM